VRLWDTATGEETLTLIGHRGSTRGVCFSPDGTRLFSVGLDAAVKSWDARPLTPEGAANREAVALLHFLLARPLDKLDIQDHLHRAPGVRPEVRQKARELLEFSREVADPDRYHRAAWALVCQPRLNRFQYGFALRQAEAACRLAPARQQYRLTLGGARYRAGHYQEALATLKEFDAIDPGVPANLAFLAMTQHCLRQTGQARMTIARLRDGVKDSLCPKQEDARVLLREAEALIQNHPPGLAR
jgi:hypothetical protein